MCPYYYYCCMLIQVNELFLDIVIVINKHFGLFACFLSVIQTIKDLIITIYVKEDKSNLHIIHVKINFHQNPLTYTILFHLDKILYYLSASKIILLVMVAFEDYYKMNQTVIFSKKINIQGKISQSFITGSLLLSDGYQNFDLEWEIPICKTMNVHFLEISYNSSCFKISLRYHLNILVNLPIDLEKKSYFNVDFYAKINTMKGFFNSSH